VGRSRMTESRGLWSEEPGPWTISFLSSVEAILNTLCLTEVTTGWGGFSSETTNSAVFYNILDGRQESPSKLLCKKIVFASRAIQRNCGCRALLCILMYDMRIAIQGRQFPSGVTHVVIKNTMIILSFEWIKGLDGCVPSSCSTVSGWPYPNAQRGWPDTPCLHLTGA